MIFRFKLVDLKSYFNTQNVKTIYHGFTFGVFRVALITYRSKVNQLKVVNLIIQNIYNLNILYDLTLNSGFTFKFYFMVYFILLCNKNEIKIQGRREIELIPHPSSTSGECSTMQLNYLDRYVPLLFLLSFSWSLGWTLYGCYLTRVILATKLHMKETQDRKIGRNP